MRELEVRFHRSQGASEHWKAQCGRVGHIVEHQLLGDGSPTRIDGPLPRLRVKVVSWEIRTRNAKSETLPRFEGSSEGAQVDGDHLDCVGRQTSPANTIDEIY